MPSRLPVGDPTALTLADPFPPFAELPVRASLDLTAVWPEPTLPFGADDTVLAVTVQSQSRYQQMMNTGRLVTGWDEIDPDLMVAYRWLGRQMMTRGLLDADSAPVWLWSSITTSALADALGPSTGDSAVMVVAVPAARCLMSSHSAWHQVLNRSWCPAPSGSDDAYARFLVDVDAAMGSSSWTFDCLPVPLRQRVETSWKWCLVPDLWPSGPVQATVSHVWAHEVLTVFRW